MGKLNIHSYYFRLFFLILPIEIKFKLNSFFSYSSFFQSIIHLLVYKRSSTWELKTRIFNCK
jgi:hypothetical protein